MPSPGLLTLVRLVMPLQRELANRLQHPVAGLRVCSLLAPNEVLVDQRPERLDVCVADRLRGLKRAAPREDRETREQAAFLVIEQVVAPGDRRPQRVLPRRRVAGAASE